MNAIYLDHNASSFLHPIAAEAMRPFLGGGTGNPASSHQFGRRARQALEDARERIGQLLDAGAAEVVFTSSATEANNLAIFGLAGTPPGTILSSAIEHPCVLEPINELARRGFRRLDLPVTPAGVIDIPKLPVSDDVRLVSIMLVNHETGAVQPVAQAAQHFKSAAFHCDAAAAAGKMPISFRQLGVTSLTTSAHKFHGPPGIGALVLRKNTRLRPLFFGGHQQQGTRPGTEPVALAVGMAAALAWCVENLDAHRAHLLDLRQRFLGVMRAQLGPIQLNGPEQDSVPGTLNVSFPGCQADALMMKLDLAGVSCSTGSACSSGSLLPSPVLLAMGRRGDILESALRFSFSPLTTEAEIDEACQRIVHCARQLREKNTT